MILSSICFVLIMYLGFKRAPGPSTFGLIWWTVFTLPVLGFVNLGPLTAASRYAYIPSVGLCLAVGGIAASLPGRVVYSRLFTGSVVAAAAALGLSASVQAGIWKSDITLFREITRSNPGFAVAHVNMGSALAREGMFDEALLSYSRAEALVPGWADVGYNRGNPLFRVGKYEAALRDYDAVLKTGAGGLGGLS